MADSLAPGRDRIDHGGMPILLADPVPDYSHTSIWVGTAILLLGLAALLVYMLRRR